MDPFAQVPPTVAPGPVVAPVVAQPPPAPFLPTLPTLPTLPPRVAAPAVAPAASPAPQPAEPATDWSTLSGSAALPPPVAATAVAMPTPATLDLISATPPVPAPAERPPKAHRRVVSTAVPHALTILGVLAGLGTQLLLIGMDDATAATEHPELVAISAAAGISFWIGWIWWTVMAARNARAVNSRALSPWTVPFELVFVTLVTVAYLAYTDEPYRTEQSDFVKLLYVLVVLITHLVVLSNFRRTAQMVGADNGDWSRVMWVPFVVYPLAVLAAIAVSASNEVLGLRVGLGVMVLGIGYWVLSMHRAMAAWERGVERRAMLRDNASSDHPFAKLLG